MLLLPAAGTAAPAAPAPPTDPPACPPAERHGRPALPPTNFEHLNFVQQPPSLAQPGAHAHTSGCYDTVLCLSTTKWVHLNFGDEGVRTLFSRVRDCLRPSGRLILEPQPWSSYRKRAKLTPEIAAIYPTLSFRPDEFVPYLLSEEGGFATVETVEVRYTTDHSEGFRRRPLLLLTKR